MCAGLDSGVRDGESCSDGTVHNSEFENGEKEGAAAFRIIGDGVGSGAGSAHSSGEGVVGGGVVVVVGVTGDWGWGRRRCLLSAKRLRLIRRKCAMRCSRVSCNDVGGCGGEVVVGWLAAGISGSG